MYGSSDFHPQPGLRRVLDAVQITAAEIPTSDRPRRPRQALEIGRYQFRPRRVEDSHAAV
jgi:hypothetical protein